MITAELLKKWSELEPERCQREPAGAIGGTLKVSEGLWTIAYQGCHFIIKDDLSVKRVNPPFFQPGDADVLFLAVIEAIESRGWLWLVKRTKHGYYAKVFHEKTFSEGHEREKAIPLLDSYLDRLSDWQAQEGLAPSGGAA